MDQDSKVTVYAARGNYERVIISVLKAEADSLNFKILVAVCCIFVVGVLGYRIFLSEYTPATMKKNSATTCLQL